MHMCVITQHKINITTQMYAAMKGLVLLLAQMFVHFDFVVSVCVCLCWCAYA